MTSSSAVASTEAKTAVWDAIFSIIALGLVVSELIVAWLDESCRTKCLSAAIADLSFEKLS